MVLQANPEVLGKLRGVSVKMLVHHSRNSEQKQWDETLVLALAGMARLLKSHLPLLLTFPAFAEASSLNPPGIALSRAAQLAGTTLREWLPNIFQAVVMH